MIRGLAVLLVFQSLGEVASRLMHGAVPGPVVGLLLLLAFLVARKQIAPSIGLAADGLLAHLSIFFIPAAVGVMLYTPTLARSGAAWGLAILFSTVAAIATTALTLRALSRGECPTAPREPASERGEPQPTSRESGTVPPK